VRNWFREVIRAKAAQDLRADQDRITDLNRQLTSLRQQQDRLLNLRLLDEIDQSTFASKNTELRDRIAKLALEVDASDRHRSKVAELAEKVFELSQSLEEKWLASNAREMRRLLQILCLNFTLVDATLVPTLRKPFDILADEPSVPLSRGDRI
jgi:predicted RNase H-like nuclease (RuvC/YqgF family)